MRERRREPFRFLLAWWLRVRSEAEQLEGLAKRGAFRDAQAAALDVCVRLGIRGALAQGAHANSEAHDFEDNVGSRSAGLPAR
jgi:hypothetical protein